MFSVPLFAQMDRFDVRPEHIFIYIALTIGFFFLYWLLSKGARPLGTNLILWGILTVILSFGYALMGVPVVMMLTPALTKIGFLLVLGGLAWSLLAACPIPTASKESDHV